MNEGNEIDLLGKQKNIMMLRAAAATLNFSH